MKKLISLILSIALVSSVSSVVLAKEGNLVKDDDEIIIPTSLKKQDDKKVLMTDGAKIAIAVTVSVTITAVVVAITTLAIKSHNDKKKIEDEKVNSTIKKVEQKGKLSKKELEAAVEVLKSQYGTQEEYYTTLIGKQDKEIVELIEANERLKGNQTMLLKELEKRKGRLQEKASNAKEQIEIETNNSGEI